MKISNNFKLSEFLRSDKANELKIVQALPAGFDGRIILLVNNLLQPICDATGWKCIISSGYRCEEVNTAVGGVPTSMHKQAEAADCKFYKKDENGKLVFLTSATVLETVLSLGLEFDQMIAYNTFVHLSFTGRRANRNQKLYNKAYKGKRA